MSENPLSTIADASKEARFGRVLAFGFAVALLVSAVVFRLDAAAHATGEVVADGRHVIVQHREGGNIDEIFVRDGSEVREGDLLVRLDVAAISASARAHGEQAVQLSARRARLLAEAQGRRTIGPIKVDTGDEGAAMNPALLDSARNAQQRQLAARWATLDAQSSVLGQRVLRSKDQRNGQGSQARSATEQIQLIDEELALLQPLAAVGHVSQTRIRSLQRARAELEGQLAAFQAGTRLSGRDSEDARLQIQAARQAFDERALTELAEVEASLADIIPRWHASQDHLRKTEIRAPVSGTVVKLSVKSVGAVVAPGQAVLEIVPANAPPRILARVAPYDADDLRIGQPLHIHFPGLHERQARAINGRLLSLSADKLTDDRTGSSYFVAEIDVPAAEIGGLRQVRGRNFVLRAGMPASVTFPLRRRSALSYLTEPLVGAFWRSLGEQ